MMAYKEVKVQGHVSFTSTLDGANVPVDLRRVKIW
jgi:hypothetical protein